MPFNQIGAIPEPFAGDGKLGGRLYTELRSARFTETTAATVGEGWILKPDGTAQFDTVTASAFTVESEYMRTVFANEIFFKPYAYDSGDGTSLWNPGGDQVYPSLYSRKEAGIDYIYTRLTSGWDASASSQREAYIELWHDQSGTLWSAGETGVFIGTWFGGGQIGIGTSGDALRVDASTRFYATTTYDDGIGAIYNHPTSGSAELSWEDDFLRYRFGGSSTPKGIRLDSYDTVGIELYRGGHQGGRWL